jgi:hypothetical protein
MATDNYPNDFLEFTEILKFISQDVRYHIYEHVQFLLRNIFCHVKIQRDMPTFYLAPAVMSALIISLHC